MNIDKVYQWLITKQQVPRWEYIALIGFLTLSAIEHVIGWFS